MNTRTRAAAPTLPPVVPDVTAPPPTRYGGFVTQNTHPSTRPSAAHVRTSHETNYPSRIHLDRTVLIMRLAPKRTPKLGLPFPLENYRRALTFNRCRHRRV